MRSVESLLSLGSIIKIVDNNLNEITEVVEWKEVWLLLNIEYSRAYSLKVYLQNKEIGISIIKTKDNKWVPVCNLGKLTIGKYSVKIFEYDIILNVFEFMVISKKIKLEDIGIIIEELNHKLPVDIAVGINDNKGFMGGNLKTKQYNTIEQEIALLKRILNGDSERAPLISILRGISNNIQSELSSEEIWVSSERVKRPQGRKLAKAYYRVGNIKDDGIPLKIIDSRSVNNYNIYENQLLKLFLEQLMYRVRRISFCKWLNNRPLLCKEINSLKKAYNQIELVIKEFDFLGQIDFPTQLSFNINMVLLKNMYYKEIFKSYIELQKNIIIKFEENEMLAQLNDIPYIYQMWATLKVLNSLISFANNNNYIIIRENILTKMNGLPIMNFKKNGKICLELDKVENNIKIKVELEKIYNSEGIIQSISFNQKPDIAIEIYKYDEPIGVIIFDPKYKLDSENLTDKDSDTEGNQKPKKEDIDKMHAYRDSIRIKQGNNIVKYAIILYPGNTQIYKEIQAWKMYPEENDDFENKIQQLINHVIN